MKATCYLLLEPRWGRYDSTRLYGFKVKTVTQKRPAGPGVAIKLVLDVPDQAFEPLRPVAEVTIGMPDLTVLVEAAP